MDMGMRWDTDSDHDMTCPSIEYVRVVLDGV